MEVIGWGRERDTDEGSCGYKMGPGKGNSRIRMGMAIEDRLWDRGWTCG